MLETLLFGDHASQLAIEVDNFGKKKNHRYRGYYKEEAHSKSEQVQDRVIRQRSKVPYLEQQEDRVEHCTQN